jgi:hypothetical protein
MNKKNYVLFSSDLHGNLNHFTQLFDEARKILKEGKQLTAVLLGG